MDLREPVAPNVYEINDHILCFYLGRDSTPPSPVADIPGNWVDLDWEWGVCSYAIYHDDHAIVFDTNVYPTEGKWIREYLANERGITDFTVVNSHWHMDHTSGNPFFADCRIISTDDCRRELVNQKDIIEAGKLWGKPAVEIVLPDITFNDRLTIYCGPYAVELHRFDLHTEDSICALLPDEGICLAADMLEDTVPFITDIAKIPDWLKELERMKTLGAARFYPDHGDYKKIANGGYIPEFIDTVIEYYTNLMGKVNDPDFTELPLEEFIPNSLACGAVTIYDPYRLVHKKNVALALNVEMKLTDHD